MSLQTKKSKPMHFWVIQVASTPRILKFLFGCDLFLPTSTRFLDCRARRLLKLSADRDEPTSPTSPLSEIHRIVRSVSWLQQTKGKLKVMDVWWVPKGISRFVFFGYDWICSTQRSTFQINEQNRFWELCETYTSFPVGPCKSVCKRHHEFRVQRLQSGVLNESMNSSRNFAFWGGDNSEYESCKTHEGSST